MSLNRRSFLAAALGAAASPGRAQQRQPNIVFIYADDLGYGDLGCYGSPMRTPHLDAMAAEGARFTNFYSAAAVCSPSRAALLTGRYPARVNVPRVLGPQDTSGLSAADPTLAEVLKSAGFRTACIGKWHVGAEKQFLPTSRGFDEYFGVPYSADMWPCPLLRGTEVIERPVVVETLTARFTEEAVNFIGRSRGAPFFLYLAHTAPHVPLAPSPRFKGASRFGAYGDMVTELDWSVGQVLAALQANGLDDNTLMMFSSDNGPWWQGSQGRLRGRKGETYEGGMREPLIARMTGAIPAGLVCGGLATTLDVMPTLARLCGAPLPTNPPDGVDIWPMLTGKADEVEREVFLYFDDIYLQCARLGRWKLHVSRFNSEVYSPVPPGGRRNLPLPRPELYDLVEDPQESYECSSAHPEIVADIRARIHRLLPTFGPDVLDAWQTTMSRRVLPESPADGLPVDDPQ